MKKLMALLLISTFVLLSVPAFAQKGANEKAMENASDQAIFHRVEDWFATIGKSGADKEKILAEKRAKRAQKRAEREAKKAKKQAKKKIKAATKDANVVGSKMKNKMKGPKKGPRKGPKKGS